MPGTESQEFKGPWPKGLDNRSRDADVAKEALRNAVNVDMLDSGAVVMRQGWTEKVSGICHSLWSEGGIALCVIDNVLTLLTVDRTGAVSEATVRSGMSAGLRVAYVLLNGDVYYSNGVQTGRIRGGVNYPWGIEHASAPRAAAAAAGGLDAGRYQVAVTFVSADGEEGGTSTSVAVQVAAGGGISVTAIPQPASAHVSHARLYVTAANGSIFYRYADVAVGTTTATIARSSTLGNELRTWDLYPAPAGDVLELHGSSILIANGPYLWFTEPFFPGQHKRQNVYPFPDDISIVARLGVSSVAVAADRHYILSGATADAFTLLPSHNYPAVKGTRIKPDDDGNGERRAWFTTQGMIVVDEGGTMVPILSGQVAIDEASVGAALYRDQNGVRQYIGALQDGAASTAAAQDYFDCEIIRRS